MHRDWIRASATADWANCPRFARLREESEARGIAAIVGTLTHALLAGSAEVKIPAKPKFDSTTRTIPDAKRQAKVMAGAIRRLYRAQGITVDRHEIDLESPDRFLRGHVDAVGMRRDRSIAIDIKTGREVGPAWLQLGAYGVLLRDAGTPVEDLAIVHMPRAPVHRLAEPTFEFRRADAVEAAFERWLAALDIMHQTGIADIATPGPHCRWCRLDCAVRAA